jgi:hypothetical protein
MVAILVVSYDKSNRLGALPNGKGIKAKFENANLNRSTTAFYVDPNNRFQRVSVRQYELNCPVGYFLVKFFFQVSTIYLNQRSAVFLNVTVDRLTEPHADDHLIGPP